MSTTNDRQGSTTRHELAMIFVSLELSRARWLVTWIFHGSNKMSKTSVAAGNRGALLALLAQIGTKTERSQSRRQPCYRPITTYDIIGTNAIPTHHTTGNTLPYNSACLLLPPPA